MKICQTTKYDFKIRTEKEDCKGNSKPLCLWGQTSFSIKSDETLCFCNDIKHFWRSSILTAKTKRAMFIYLHDCCKVERAQVPPGFCAKLIRISKACSLKFNLKLL